MITKDEALKLALEALEKIDALRGPFMSEHDVEVCWKTADEAITTIKEALAAPVQEPAVWTATRLWNRKENWTSPADIERDLMEGYTNQPAAPVHAWREALERIADPRNVHFSGDAQVVAREALATAPVRREHITDKSCWCQPVLDYKDPDTGAEVWVHNEPH